MNGRESEMMQRRRAASGERYAGTERGEAGNKSKSENNSGSTEKETRGDVRHV